MYHEWVAGEWEPDTHAPTFEEQTGYPFSTEHLLLCARVCTTRPPEMPCCVLGRATIAATMCSFFTYLTFISSLGPGSAEKPHVPTALAESQAFVLQHRCSPWGLGKAPKDVGTISGLG